MDTVLEYARKHGLSRDHTLDYPLHNLAIQPLTTVVTTPRLVADKTFSPHEEWHLDQAAASLLYSVLTWTGRRHDELSTGHANLRTTIKIPQTLLSTDEDLDYALFTSTSSVTPLAVQEVGSLPPNALSSLAGTTREEKWSVEPSSLAFLQAAIHNNDIDSTQKPAWSTKMARIDSPLLPLSPDQDLLEAEIQLPPLLPDLADSLEPLGAISGLVTSSPPKSRDGADFLLFSSPRTLEETQPVKRPSRDDLRLETPLLPCCSEEPSPKRIKLEAINLDRDGGSAITDDGYALTFDQFIDYSRGVDHALEHEQLDLESTSRMSLPQVSAEPLDPTNLPAPTPLALARQKVLVSGLSWKAVPNHDYGNLPKEHFEDYMVAYMESLSLQCEIPTSFSTKKPGLRILDDSQEDQLDLVPELYPSEDDPALDNDAALDVTANYAKFGGLSSLMTLDRFFELSRGIQPSASIPRNDATTMPTKTHQVQLPAQPLKPGAPATEPVFEPIPLPIIDHARAPPQIILSSTVLAQRSLVRQLSLHLPHTSVEEADLESATQADIHVPPGTAILLTTLQRIKQRSLPGSRSALNTIHARIEKVAASLKGQELLIFVSEGQPVLAGQSTMPPRKLDSSDHAALREVRALVSSRAGAARVVFVPGSERELAGWVAAELCGGDEGGVRAHG